MPKSIAEKLLIKPNTTIWATPSERLEAIGPLPDGVERAEGPEGAGVAVLFAADEQSLREALAQHGAGLGRAGTVWVAYPKGNRADINRDSVWPILGEYGLRPIGQVAVDEVWSALRFRPLKEGEVQFSGGRS